MSATRSKVVPALTIALLLLCCGYANAQSPAITGISPTSGAVGVPVIITGTGFGATQASSTVSLNGTSAAVTSWSGTSIVAIVPSGGTSGTFQVTVSGQAANSTSFTVTPLPSGWSDADVGSVGVGGSTSYASGTFTVSGAGTQMSVAADAMHFAYQPMSGDATIVARVASTQGSGAQAGVMIRESLNSGATMAQTFYYSRSIDFQSRSTTGSGASFQNSSLSITVPYWVKVVRSGSSFSGYVSPDGLNWTQIGSTETITMAESVYVGLSVSSQSTTTLATATIDNVSINATAAPGPVITSVSATTGSAGSPVAISGSGFGSSQGNSLVTLNAIPATVNSWNDTLITINIPAGATSGLLVVSVTPSMNDSNPVVFTVTSQPLPASWLDQDVGVTGMAGTGSYANGIFTVEGAGQQIGQSIDGMHFVYQPMSGDGTIVARVVSAQGSGTLAGVMIRETLGPGATMAQTFYHSSYAFFQYRTTSVGSADYTQSSTSATVPYWVKVVRSGGVFSGYTSPNGLNWTQVGSSETISIAESVYVGLSVSSESTTALATATFDNVSINTAAAPGPVISSVSATTASIGSQVAISGSGFGSLQGNSQVMLNGTSMTVNSWSDTSISITISAGATSGLLGVSVAPSMNNSNPVVFTVTSQPLPTSWLDQDVGAVGAMGSSSYSNGVFTVKGAGQLGGSADAIHFVYQPLSGNATMVARVASLQGTNAEAGVMIRQSLSPSDMTADSDYYDADSYVFFRYRTAVGATAQTADAAAKSPYWVEVVRNGSTFSGYMSTDGLNWVQVGTAQTINMTQSVYIGLAVATSNTTTLATATFDNVSISSPAVPAPVIASVSATTGPVGGQIVINGSGFGAAQGGSEMMLNDSPMTIDSWTDISITITIATGATSGPLVVSVAPAMNNSNPVVFTVTAQPLPSAWLDQDVGSAGLAGSSSYANGVFTVQGAGGGTFSTADGMHFVYQPLSGDGTIIARVVSLQGGSGPQAGVMIRETLNPGATMAFASYRLGYGYFDYRTTTGGSSSSATIYPVALPYWVEVVRSGNSLSGYMSLDGVNWRQVGSTESITMAQSVFIGLAVSSDSTTSLATATFDNVSVNSAATPAPIITGVSATSGSIGSQVAIYGSGFGSTQGSSLVMVNDLPASINSWGATAITIAIPTGATSGPLGVSLGPSMNSSNPVPFTVTSNPIPSGWLDQDIGAVGQAGSASYASGVFTVQGTGTLFGTADTLHFVYQPLSGNGTIIARVASLSGAGSPQAGVMIRETLESGATFAATPYIGAYGYFYWRTTTGGSSSYNDHSAGSLPYWVEVVRNGSTFSSYISPDGVNWTSVGTSQTISMAQNIYIGLSVSNNSTSSLTTATIDNVSVSLSITLPTPVITGITPTAALPFSSVTISGNNFQPSQGSSMVTFNGTAASVSTWSSTSISTSVPSGATSGNVTVTVNGLSSNGINFSVLQQPTISGISPVFTGRGSQVTITGTNFGAAQGNSSVTFNGSTATSIVSWSPTQIVTVVPNNATSGPVVVTVTGLQTAGNPTFTVIDPVINSLLPASAGPGGEITLNGSGFGISNAGVSVQFNGVAAQSSFVSNDSTVTAVVPSNATSGPVTITIDGVVSNGVQFTVVEELSITGISPAVGPIGTSVTITGAGFGASQSDSTVAFYGVTASVSSWSDSQIVAIVPSDALPGPVSIQVAGVTISGPSFTVNSTIQLTDSLGNQSSYTSDLFGGMWHVIQSAGSGCSSCTQRGNITSQFDASGDLIASTDELAHTTSYTYDLNHDVTSTSQQTSSGATARTSYTYNSFGEVLAMTDPLGNVTTNTYDSHGNLLTVTTPRPNGNTAASVTQFAYNSLGEITQITDPLNRVTTLTYTSAGLIATITDPQSNITTYQYNSQGDRTSVTDAMSHTTTFAYDAGHRLTGVTYPDMSTASFTYDYRGRRITATDQNGKTTSYAYDDADRLTSVIDAASNVTQYAYDTESNLLSITDANGHETSFTYDPYGRVTETTFPSNYFETYAYDAGNNLISKTDRKGQTIEYVYDALNRLTQKTYPDSTSVDYIYDLAGKVLEVNDPTGTYGFAYDIMGRLIGTTTQYSFLPGNSFSNSYSYDAASNRTGYTAPDGSTVAYTYDTLNRMTNLASSWAGSFGFSYDALSRRTQLTRPNNVATSYSYDSLSRLLSVLHQLSGSTIDGASYTLDAAGNRTAKVNDLSGGATSNYTYDNIYELLSVVQGTNTTESYTYDPVGNRLSSLGMSPYSYNTSNELTSTSAASYGYDYNGNTTSKTVSGNTTSYAWDYENRLTSVTLPNSGGTVTFKYDPFGRRIEKISPTATSIFAYDGQNLVETVNGSGGLVARYTQDRDIDEPLAMERGTTTDYYEQDGIGSVTSLSSSTGTLAQTYTYDSFGNTTNSSGSLTNFFRYTAREFDTETNLYNYRARYYDSSTGRFIKEDPIQFGSGDPNFYDYVSNNPVVYTDPTGRLRIYGNWCGPDWTGGQPEPYDPSHAGIYKPPVDRYDTVCMHHDICYFNCRSTQPCDPSGRSSCFKVCDQIFVDEMPGYGPVPDLLVMGIYWHGKFGPDPGPNSPNCPSCKQGKP